MSDPKSPHIQTRSDPPWGVYQRENFWKLNDGQVPPFNTRESSMHLTGWIEYFTEEGLRLMTY